MASAPRLRAQWDGEAFVVRPNQREIADKHFVVGETYWITEYEERSRKSHDHYFAALQTAWDNLPEEWGFRFPTVEHLRKYVLIRCGYRDERTFVCKDKAEALRMAAFLRPIDDFAFVHVDGATVTHWTAKTQSKRAMGGKVFQESKQKVFDYLCSNLGISPETLKAHAHHDT